MIHTDQSGNQYRKQGDEWQVMRPGVGWGPFTCAEDIQLTSGEVIPASAKPHDEPKWSEAEKSLIISQARDIHMKLDINNYDRRSDYLAQAAVLDAIALVKELKREGVL